MLEAIKSGTIKYDAVKVDELKTRVFGDSAIVTGLVTAKTQVGGQTQSGIARNTATLVKGQGRWQIVASHASAVRQ
jgi:ketosteroid isomerase-like protein